MHEQHSVDCHQFPCERLNQTGSNLLGELVQTGSHFSSLVVHAVQGLIQLAVRTGSNCSNQFLCMSSVVTDSPLLTGSNWFKLAVRTGSNCSNQFLPVFVHEQHSVLSKKTVETGSNWMGELVQIAKTSSYQFLMHELVQTVQCSVDCH